jgi:serine/threonine-protein kinase
MSRRDRPPHDPHAPTVVDDATVADATLAPPARGALSGLRFTDEGVVGRGGFSHVHQVYDPVLLRRTALKVLTLSSERAAQRFLAEAQVTGQLEHPGIVPVHEYGTDGDGRPYINMKLVSGQTLRDRVRELGEARLEPDHLDQLLSVLLKVCDALSYAHDRGVLHLDLKPSNIMVGAFGVVYLLDWGIARAQDGGDEDSIEISGSWDHEQSAVGTPAYMAPEQFDGHDAGERTDVYALGGVLYTILAGRPPHPDKTLIGAMRKAVEGDIEPPSALVHDALVPAGLEAIALRALQPDPEARFASAAAFRREIELFRRGGWRLPSRTVAAGEVVVAEGEPGEEAYVIVRGRCAVHSARRGFIRELSAGDAFGEMALVNDSVRTSTVRATTETVLHVVTRDTLEAGLGLNTWAGCFVRTLARRFAELESSS